MSSDGGERASSACSTNQATYKGVTETEMSVIDLLKKVVEAIAVDEASVWGETRHASVGILIAGENQCPSICFIRRAKWERDPWSEHIAFPGGSRAADEDALQTLRRELEEE